MTEVSILCDKPLRLTHFSHSYRSWRTDIFLPVLGQTVLIDTFFAFRSFLVAEQNFHLPLCVCLLLTLRARVKRNPLVTVKIRVAGLSWACNKYIYIYSYFEKRCRRKAQNCTSQFRKVVWVHVLHTNEI